MPPPPPSPQHKAQATLIQPPLPTPHWGPQTGSAFTVRANITINATADAILDALLNTADYPRWNSFVPRVTISTAGNDKSRLAQGVTFTEHVDMFRNGRPSGMIRMKLVMTTLQDHHQSQDDAGAHARGERYTVVWLGRALPDWALRSERVHRIMVDEGGGGVTYDVYETFSGVLAGVTRLVVGRALVERFAQWNEELKGYVEGRR